MLSRLVVRLAVGRCLTEMSPSSVSLSVRMEYWLLVLIVLDLVDFLGAALFCFFLTVVHLFCSVSYVLLPIHSPT